MKRQGIHALLSLDAVNTNYRCLAGEFDRGDNRIDFCGIEIVLELLE